jgi:hypothetical protein
MIYTLTDVDLAEIHRLMLAGAATDAERFYAEDLAATIAHILGERDYIAKSLEGHKDAFNVYTAKIEEIHAKAHREAEARRILERIPAPPSRELALEQAR